VVDGAHGAVVVAAVVVAVAVVAAAVVVTEQQYWQQSSLELQRLLEGHWVVLELPSCAE